MNNRIKFDLSHFDVRRALSVRLPVWSLCIALLALFFVVQAGEIDPARSQALLQTLQSPDASFNEKARACQQSGEFGTTELVPALALLLADEKLAPYARSGLENIPGPEASAALIAALATLQGELLGGAIDSLAMRRVESAVPALQVLATEGAEGTAGKALLALGAIANEACIKTLRQRFKSAPSAVKGLAAAGMVLAAQRCQHSGDSGTARQLCDELLAAELPGNLRSAAVHGAILAHGIGDPDFLTIHLTATDPEIRNAARLAVQSFPVGELAKVLIVARDKAESGNKALLEDTLQVLCFQPLITGKKFIGWEGEIASSFRREGEAIVGGNLKQDIPRNEFLATTRFYTNFVLTAECRLAGEKCNGGIQIRTQRIPDHHEVIGYQADMSTDSDGGYWGKLYDESRRSIILGDALNHVQMIGSLNADGWNQYEIRCEGPRIQLFLNGIQTLDYTEEDQSIPQYGLIALQIHSGPPSEAWYRNLQIVELP